MESLGTLKTPFKLNDRQIPRANFFVVAVGFKHILRRKSFDQLDITIKQKICPIIEINNIDHQYIRKSQ